MDTGVYCGEEDAMDLSRRDLARLFGAAAVSSALPPLLAQPAPRSSGAGVRLSANENPYGPSASAMAAMRDALVDACRYPDEATDALTNTIARLHNVSADQVILGDGSSEILKLAAATFTGPLRPVVVADPTFEAIAAYGRAAGAETVKVPLTPSFEHDLAKMAAVKNAGAIYVCNPNNPTASITNKQSVRSFLDAVPSDTVVLVDEAYFHFVDAPQYETVIPLVAVRPNLVVARTFSKIYAMAGIRCGYAIGPVSLMRRMKVQKAWDSMNAVALAGAHASLMDTNHVAIGRKRNADTRQQTVNTLTRLGYEVIPSYANFFMVDIRQPVKPVITALRDLGVHVGRLFPTMPNYLRVTVGKPDEMQTFVAAFRSVMV